MKSTLYYNSEIPDDERCQQLYDRQLFVSSPRKSILDFVGFARSIICAFGDLVPRTAQDRIELERYADLLGKLKPGFIHHLESKRHFADDARGFGDYYTRNKLHRGENVAELTKEDPRPLHALPNLSRLICRFA